MWSITFTIRCNDTGTVDELRPTNIRDRSLLIERSCPIEGFAFIDTRSHTMEFHLENRGLLDKCPKNSRCKRHRAQKGTRAVFPRVPPCYAPRAIPSHSLLAQFLPPSHLPAYDLSRLSTFSPLNPDTPQMPRLRFRDPFVARRHARWRVPTVTSRTCAGLLWRKESARYNDPFFRVRCSRWDVCTLDRGILDSLQREARADATIAHVAWFHQTYCHFFLFIASH